MTHTPGPWTSHDKGIHPNPYVCGPTVDTEHGEDQFVVAYIMGVNTEANARIIAAAPDLLDTLKAIVLYGETANIDKGGPYWGGGKKPPTMDAWAFPRHMLTAIEEAIAKAEGTEPELIGTVTVVE